MKKIKYNNIETKNPNNPKNKNKFIPEINTKASHVKTIKIVWPMSGWDIKSKTTGIIRNNVNKYLTFKLYFW